MAKIKTILFYSDSEIYGGHEIMSVNIANTLIRHNYNIEFIFFNRKISENLDDNIIKHYSQYSDKIPFPFIRNLNFYQIFMIKNKIQKIKPDLVIICQGNIELCLKGLLASFLAKIKTVSYIPSSQYFKSIGSLFYTLRDSIGELIFKIPDCFITPNNYQKNIILDRSSNKNIFIVRNPIKENTDLSIRFKKNKVINLGIIGRINLRIKNQLLSIKLAEKLLDKNIDFIFHIIGDGKDLEKFKKMIHEKKIIDNFIFYGWLDEVEKNKIINKYIDIIIVPSKIETGLPLAVYDAFNNNKKFLMSNIESVKHQIIPDKFLINIYDIDSVVKKIIDLNELIDSNEYLDFRKKIYNKNSMKKYKNQLINTIDELLCGQ